MAQVPPFFDSKKLATLLQEEAMRLSHAAVILASNPEGSDLKLLMTRKHYFEVANKWWSKYSGIKPQAAADKDRLSTEDRLSANPKADRIVLGGEFKRPLCA
jgi:hypothetical protein